MRVLLIVYDNGSYVHAFPQGMAYIAAVLQQKGHEVTIYNQDVHHYCDEHLTWYLDNRDPFDVVGLGIIGGYWQYQKMLSISKAIAASKKRPTLYMLGGHGPSPCPEYFLKKSGADVVVLGEGEETVVSLLNRLETGQGYRDILGIAYAKDGRCFTNPKRPLANIDTIPWPMYELFPIEYYRLERAPNCEKTDFVMPVASGRGCTFRCNFCYRMDKGFRPRNAEILLAEIEFLQQRYGITYIDFSDELLMASEARTLELCSWFAKARKPFRWACNGRLNYATPAILNEMKRTGCVFINYGIESFDDEALQRMNKHLTTEQIVKGVENTIASGISPGLNIIWGNLGEDARTLQQSVDFLLKYADTSQLRTIRPVTPYPGSDLFTYAVKHGLLKDVEEFYEKRHTNSDLLAVNFTALSDEDFYHCLMEANCELLMEHYRRRMIEHVNTAIDLYTNRNSNFRGYRQM